jgi:hypothetical protein
MADRAARLQEIYDELGRPGVQAYRFAVRRAGLQITESEAKEFVAHQSTGQVFQGRLNSDGRIPSGGGDSSRAQADLIDFSKRIAKLKGGARFVLIVVDLYDRQLWAIPQRSKSAEDTLQAWRKVIQSNGNVTFGEVSVDQGNEFRLLGPEIESKGGVLRHKDMRQLNSIAVVDAAISKLKRILSGYNLTSWAEVLKKATIAYNDSSHSALMGSAPDDVKGSDLLQYELEKKHGQDIRHNNQRWRQKIGRLRDQGAFRTPLPRDTWERISAPKFGGEVHQVASFKGANVEDEQGRSFPVKTALAVPAESQSITLDTDVTAGGGKRARQREMLQDFATNLAAMVPSTGLTLAMVGRILRGQRGFIDTADTYGPARVGRYVSFLKLYTHLFSIQGSGPGLKVFPAEKPPPAAPRAVQVGGASASSAAAPPAAPRERAERALEIDPRAPYRKYPPDQRIRYGANPARRGARRARYEIYKVATTIGEARRLGASPQDIQQDLEKAALVLL